MDRSLADSIGPAKPGAALTSQVRPSHLLLIGLAWALIGCAPNGPILFKENRFPPLELQARVVSLGIRDDRKDSSEIKIPFLTGIGTRMFAKPIAAADSFAVIGQVRRNVTGQGVPVHLLVSIEEAVVGYENSIFKELERGRFKIRIGFWHAHAKIAECTGKASLERRTLNTTEGHLREIFEEGLILSIYQCLESTKEELRKGQRTAPGASPI